MSERDAIWFSKLSMEEKEFVEDTSRDYIMDIRRLSEKFLRSGNEFLEISRERAAKEIEMHEEIIAAFKRCTSRKDTLDEIVACVKDETKTYIIPESTGAVLGGSIKDMRETAQQFEV